MVVVRHIWNGIQLELEKLIQPMMQIEIIKYAGFVSYYK